MSLKAAKETFLETIRGLESNEKIHFLKWIAEEWDMTDLDGETLMNEDAQLMEIASEIRGKVPGSGVLPSENIYEPTNVSKEERDMTLHVDEFLYDDDYIEKMVEEGALSRYRCIDCGSTKIKPLNMISHSCSVERMRFLFTAVLPPLDGKVFLDVGSRLGAVLFGAYLLSSAKRIVGVEMNVDLCRLAREVLDRRHMLDRVDLIQADVCSQGELVSEADVVLVSNSFEYFADRLVAVKCWRFLFTHLKPGATLVLSPRAETTFQLYDIGVPWCDWLSQLPLHDPDAPGISDWDALQDSMVPYRVKDVKPVLPPFPTIESLD